jgi:hypothetical protein
MGRTTCPAGPFGGNVCVDLMTDPSQCGMCGNACAEGDVCMNGMCTCAGTNCPAAGGNPAMCIAPTTSALHCGTGCASAACGDDQVCAAGACTCRPGLTQCTGVVGCVDLQEDVQHCGMCRTDCTTMGFGNARCVMGVCRDIPLGGCPMGTTGCNGTTCLTNADFLIDPLNCGGCNNACAVGEVCAAGRCQASFQSPSCTSCPCAACGTGTTCCTYASETLCVAGNSC